MAASGTMSASRQRRSTSRGVRSVVTPPSCHRAVGHYRAVVVGAGLALHAPEPITVTLGCPRASGSPVA
ncbi:MAG: hypothetical protein ACTHJW_28155 [Streptosporangiaceae bacterium]